jgi:hypothetical protein
VKNHSRDKTGFCIYKRKHFAMEYITPAHAENLIPLYDKAKKHTGTICGEPAIPLAIPEGGHVFQRLKIISEAVDKGAGLTPVEALAAKDISPQGFVASKLISYLTPPPARSAGK